MIKSNTINVRISLAAVSSTPVVSRPKKRSAFFWLNPPATTQTTAQVVPFRTGGRPLGSGGWPLGSGGWPLGNVSQSEELSQTVGLGYHRDLPDFRDWCLSKIPTEIKVILRDIRNQNQKQFGKKNKNQKARSFLLGELKTLPKSVDLRETGFFSPVETQGDISSCTAQSVIGIVEYLMLAGGCRDYDMSRMFLYKVTRRLLGWEGDPGAYIRSTIKAMSLFGIPPETEWPYERDLLNTEPDAYHYAYAQNFKALKYARVDTPGQAHSETLTLIKKTLADGFPMAFGFPVYDSIGNVTRQNPVIPFPSAMDKLQGGHAVIAVGYDDSRKCLILRNSWGGGWGEAGYAYLPYKFVEEGLANDFWAVFNQDWVDLSQFE